MTLRKRYQDLWHTLILLGTVPLLFFAALKLLEESTDVLKQPNPTANSAEIKADSVPVKADSTEATTNPVVVEVKQESVPPVVEKKPPPGVAWLSEVAELEQRVESLRSVENIVPARITQIQARLAIMRQHIEQHLDSVPAHVQNDPSLGIALKRLSDEIRGLAQSVAIRPDGLNWKETFAASDAKRKSDHAAAVTDKVNRLTASLKQSHSAKLAEFASESTIVSDQIQNIAKKERLVQNQTIQAVARLERLRAFDAVRTEAMRLLSPFITPNYDQPRNVYNEWNTTNEKKPISWNTLERLGALNPTLEGLQILSMIGSQHGRQPESRRPLGSFPYTGDTSLNRPRDIEATKRAQRLINDHKQVLIEEGLLSP
ncbi:MAG: hypothetical protein ACKV2Q_15290 [Planctomycetaceae bacterium]